MATLKIAGTICPNDYGWFYEWMEQDYTSPEKVQKAIDDANGDLLDVEINSPGGEIASGSEIYTMLKSYGNIRIHVTGQACSAASVIAMAGWSEMSPTALMMVHCVSSRVAGNHADMEKMAETLRTADEAMCGAYMAKSGMTQEEALDMMEHETWLTANQAKELNLIDAIMFDEEEDPMPLTASLFGLPTDEQLDAARKEMTLQNELLKARDRAENLRTKGGNESE